MRRRGITVIFTVVLGFRGQLHRLSRLILGARVIFLDRGVFKSRVVSLGRVRWYV
jgi:hypothetical protein